MANERFEIGEVAIIVRFDDLPGFVGNECVVKSSLVTIGGRDWYEIEMPGYKGKFGALFARPNHLRKKKPPERELDQKVSWDDCIWNPNKQTVIAA